VEGDAGKLGGAKINKYELPKEKPTNIVTWSFEIHSR
jgi:hypothetical protein